MNPNLNATLTALRALLMAIGSVLADHGLQGSSWYSYVMIAAGSVMVIGPAIWGVWSSIVNWRKAAAVGAAAGINMTVQGKALAENGSVISKFGAGAEDTPPKPVTVASAQDIVANFAPPSGSIAKS